VIGSTEEAGLVRGSLPVSTNAAAADVQAISLHIEPTLLATGAALHLVIIQGSIELLPKALIFLTEGRQVEVPGKRRIDYLIKLSLLRL
jgi:hypothetical protein